METSYSHTLKNIQERARLIYTTLSPEKVLLMWSFFAISILLLFASVLVFNTRFLIEIPALGGHITEGITGTVRFINPVLASSPQDLDLTTLVYAGITKRNEHGEYTPDLAQSIQKSEDGLRYDVTIKSNAVFHDGSKITADDIIFTVLLVQNPRIKSPQAILWEGVTVQKIADDTVSFSLKQPYPLFTEALSLGIMPKHVWKDLSEEQFSLSDYNIHPVGSGPYSLDKVASVSGIPEEFTLKAHTRYTLGRPYISTLTLRSYPTEKSLVNAYNNGDIDAVAGLSPSAVSGIEDIDKSTLYTSVLPKTFTLFLNPNKAQMLSDKNIRKALSMAIDRKDIVDTIYKGYAKALSVPYPFDDNASTTAQDIDAAKTLLANNKYLKKASTTPTLTIITTNSEEMRKVADIVKKNWESIGISTTVLVYETSDINQAVIKERDFQVLLYGSFVGHPSDLYAFWHSSQRNYPGVNISGYVSKKLDDALTTLRQSEDITLQAKAYALVKQEFEEEVPGIFIFSPTLIYLSRNTTHLFLPDSLLTSSDRFSLVHTWYERKERVWKGTYYKSIISTLEKILH